MTLNYWHVKNETYSSRDNPNTLYIALCLVSPYFPQTTTGNETDAENVVEGGRASWGRWEPAAGLHSAATLSERTAEAWMRSATRPSACAANSSTSADSGGANHTPRRRLVQPIVQLGRRDLNEVRANASQITCIFQLTSYPWHLTRTWLAQIWLRLPSFALLPKSSVFVQFNYFITYNMPLKYI